jgi:hypothetical protein
MQPNEKGLPMTGERIAVILVFGALVLSGIALVGMMIRARQRLQELAIQERIALIERGLIPSPETDPAGFERLMSARRPPNRSGARYQSAGVLIMGLGAALAVLLAFAARQFNVGLGLGGAVAILGFASFINGALMSGEAPGPTRAGDS